ncbi:hypothetical protein H7849_22995 [Alloacidobacterium dinghuense]|uniref:Uncharacterized protein n=1 Tax=Alloacidobacterium dinghuense TaxID=2763107 RepID=A0A7G8BH44_9BACT|nr:hypothetical protein [Alloacidobacterium dinghuense]QNI31864.1 hypothetical protein H7849_22995 [Alloacidobacterium dinghuense]
MDQDQTQALSAVAGLLLEMTARQMAIFSLLKEQGISEEKITQATAQARQYLGKHGNLTTIRSRMSASYLEAFERTIQGILFPR